MVCITRSQARFASGQQAKYVLEQPPVLFTIVNILANQNLKKEACCLKLVLKSDAVNEIIDKAFTSTRYTYHYNNALAERKKRFVKIVAHWLNLNQVIGTSKKYKTKITYNLFSYLVLNKDLINMSGCGFEKFKVVVLRKINELLLDPYPVVVEMMISFRTQLMY
jgi:hypothetical protein